MSSGDQLALFDPDAEDASRLLSGYLRDARLRAAAADRFELLGMTGAVVQSESAMRDAIESATVLALYLDLLLECGGSS
jgi:hypothetical protein